MRTTDGQNLRFLFGIKLKQFRHQAGLTLKAFAERTGMSTSYLSEIEKGKKYPKPEKMIALAAALGRSFDELVTVSDSEGLSPVAEVLDSPLLREFPLHLFGIEPEGIVGLVREAPQQASALARTLSEIAHAYDMHVEQFLFAALRSYQQMHLNYFDDLEAAALQFAKHHRFNRDEPVAYEQLRSVLERDYGYRVVETGFAGYPELAGYRSIVVEGRPRQLFINAHLRPPQKAFLAGRELGFSFLGLQERPTTSTWLQVESFDQVLDNFKASYFAGALLIDKARLMREVRAFFRLPRWDAAAFVALMHAFQATPEMFLYRLSQLVPTLLGLRDLHYLRFQNRVGTDEFKFAKRLNMSRVQVPYGVDLNEHYCRRWLSIQALQRLAIHQKSQSKVDTLAFAQRSRFILSGDVFFTLTLARPLALQPDTNSSMTIGFLVDDEFRRKVRFWNDPQVPEVDVNETCERCGLSAEACRDRVAPPIIYQQQQEQRRRAEALARFLEDKRLRE